VLTVHLLPAAAAQLDDVLVVGYGEWESRKALESHLQKGADLQNCGTVHVSEPGLHTLPVCPLSVARKVVCRWLRSVRA
jgi:hypothetical protein